MDYNQEKTKKRVPKTEDGQVGIRATLNNMGFSDAQIGYDEASGGVTLDGKHLITPEYMDQDAGVSYAKESDIQKSLVDFYQGTQNPVVRVSDAYGAMAGKYGLSADALTYGNGTVSLGGKPLNILYVDGEGKAWARQSDVENATAGYVKTVGVQSPTALAEAYARTYLNGAENLVQGLMNREAFSYQPENDPVYLAYRNQYLREGERAGRNAVADYATLTGGFENSAAATAGAQARQYYAKQLSDTIPELAKLAYQRYVEKYQTDLNLLSSMVDLYDTAYQNAASANQKQKENANVSAASNVERDQRAWENNWQETLWQQTYDANALEYARTRQEMEQEAGLYPLELEGLDLSNQEKAIYLMYYQSLLEGELTKTRLDNQIKQGKL